MADHDDIDRRWRAANRVPAGITHTDASRELMDEIRARIVASERPSKERRRFRLRFPATRRGVVLGSVIGALAVGGAAAATATILSSNTVGAPGFCQTTLNATADIPFPSGDQAWRNWALLESVGPKPGTTLHELCDTAAGVHVADDGYPGAFVIPTIGQKVGFVMAAFCAWTDEWLNAQSDGDAATASQSASEIAGALQWPASQAIDRPGSGVGSAQLAWFVPVQRAVQTDDVSEVASTFEYQARGTIPASECFSIKPPADSDNGTVAVTEP